MKHVKLFSLFLLLFLGTYFNFLNAEKVQDSFLFENTKQKNVSLGRFEMYKLGVDESKNAKFASIVPNGGVDGIGNQHLNNSQCLYFTLRNANKSNNYLYARLSKPLKPNVRYNIVYEFKQTNSNAVVSKMENTIIPQVSFLDAIKPLKNIGGVYFKGENTTELNTKIIKSKSKNGTNIFLAQCTITPIKDLNFIMLGNFIPTDNNNSTTSLSYLIDNIFIYDESVEVKKEPSNQSLNISSPDPNLEENGTMLSNKIIIPQDLISVTIDASSFINIEKQYSFNYEGTNLTEMKRLEVKNSPITLEIKNEQNIRNSDLIIHFYLDNQILKSMTLNDLNSNKELNLSLESQEENLFYAKISGYDAKKKYNPFSISVKDKASKNTEILKISKNETVPLKIYNLNK